MALAFALEVEGVQIADVTIADVRLSVGRRSIGDDVEAGALTITVHHSQTGMNGVLALENRIRLTVDVDGMICPLFVGWITDVTSEMLDWGLWSQQVVATGPLAALTRIDTSGEWPTETDSLRVARILESVGHSSALVPVEIQGPLVTAQSVEADPEAVDRALMLVADSAGGLIYEDHDGGLIGYQPQLQRYRGMQVLWDLATGTWDTMQGAWSSPGAPSSMTTWEIPAAAVLLDPFKWEQHISDLITYCEVIYGVEGALGEPRPVVSAGSLDPPVYSQSIDTVLDGQADAVALADRIVTTRNVPRWNAPATVLRLDFTPMTIAETLSVYLVPGRPVVITELPPGSPYADFHGFLEGWEHRILADAGDEDETQWRWECEMWLSDEALTMPMTTWDQLDASWSSISDIWDTALIIPPEFTAPAWALADANVPSSTSTAGPYALATVYRPTQPIQIVAARWYRMAGDSAESRALRLYIDGVLTGVTEPTAEGTGAGWVTASFTEPVDVAADQEIMICLDSSVNRFYAYHKTPPTMRDPSKMTYVMARYGTVGAMPDIDVANYHYATDVEYRERLGG